MKEMKPKIKYNTDIEVSAVKYRELMHFCAGSVAGQIRGDRYFIRVWFMWCRNRVTFILE